MDFHELIHVKCLTQKKCFKKPRDYYFHHVCIKCLQGKVAGVLGDQKEYTLCPSQPLTVLPSLSAPLTQPALASLTLLRFGPLARDLRSYCSFCPENSFLFLYNSYKFLIFRLSIPFSEKLFLNV